MTQTDSHVLDYFNGLHGNDIGLRLAVDLDYGFIESLVCTPSTVAATNETPDSARNAFRKMWSEGLNAPDLRHFIAESPQRSNRVAYLRLLYPFVSDRGLWMSFLVVLPELRGKGFGRRILELLLVGAKASPHIRTFGMHTSGGNISAIGLYESLGFECVKREPWKNEDGTEDERLTLVQRMVR